MTALIDLCNRALAEIAAGAIADFAEGSLEAREVNRFVLPLLAEASEWAEWAFSTHRVILAEVPNDRPAEWNHAYAVPADFARAIAIRAMGAPADDRRCGGLPWGGPVTLPWQDALPLAMRIEAGVIHCNVPRASLVYVRRLMDGATLPPLLARAIELELAARIALPLRKDPSLASALGEAARIARDRAIAADFNGRMAGAVYFISEAELARVGAGDRA